MGEVIDARPDRFLRELREGNHIPEAAAAAGMSIEELDELIRETPSFGLAARECMIESAEERMRASVDMATAQLKDLCQQAICSMETVLTTSLKEARDG